MLERFVLRLVVLAALICGVVSSFGQAFTSSNLPIVVIDTEGAFIQDEPKITANMGIVDNGVGVRNNLTDAFNVYNGKIGIELRGSSSQMFPKKPYGIELRDANGNGISMPILGMPAEEDWVLIATYNDKSLMRDALAYKLGRDLGRYAPRTRFCEVVINGEYLGVYMLAEGIKRDKNRVDISKLEPNEISGDDLTGGYIIKIDKSTGNSGEGFASRYPPLNRSGTQVVYFQYEYPKFDEIVTQQKAYIQKYVDDFEMVLKSHAYADPVNGYQKYIDVDSFIDYLIINEISKNVDGYRLSTFLYKDKKGKLTMGPVWDFNLAFGNADYCLGGPTDGWMYNFNYACNQDWWLIPFWWSRLLSDQNFSNKLGNRWHALREDKLSKTTINTYIDSLATVLNVEAQQRNFTKWPVLGQYVWPNYFVGQTYQQEVTFLKSWISDRLTWLDYNMPHPVITSNEENTNSEFILWVYPNPVQDVLQLRYTIQKPGPLNIELYNVTGTIVDRMETIVNQPGDYTLEREVRTLARGIYFLRAQQNGRSVFSKVVKQ